MPDRNTVEAFAARVESGDFVGAIEDFYQPDASMQENGAPPRSGRDRLVAHERKVMVAFPTVRASRLGPILIEGEEVAIRWRFEMTDGEGRTRSFEEVAWQTWRDGRVAVERFFYDPKQMAG